MDWFANDPPLTCDYAHRTVVYLTGADLIVVLGEMQRRMGYAAAWSGSSEGGIEFRYAPKPHSIKYFELRTSDDNNGTSKQFHDVVRCLEHMNVVLGRAHDSEELPWTPESIHTSPVQDVCRALDRRHLYSAGQQTFDSIVKEALHNIVSDSQCSCFVEWEERVRMWLSHPVVVQLSRNADHYGWSDEAWDVYLRVIDERRQANQARDAEAHAWPQTLLFISLLRREGMDLHMALAYAKPLVLDTIMQSSMRRARPAIRAERGCAIIYV